MHIDLGGRTVPAGTAYFTAGRGRVSTIFVYDPAFLADPHGYDIDPALGRQTGQQYVDGLPGAFSDSAPDRWGRNLIDKRRRALQRQSKRRLPAASDVDYLVGVSDITRQGNLRFTEGDGPFLATGHDVPKLMSLPRLLASADIVSEGRDADDLAAVKALLDAGSASLGGARPKAPVRADDGTLLIAKFPHRNDLWDVMAWEKTTLDLAEAAGLRVPRSCLIQVGSRNVLLLERFDRVPDGVRVGYISAMTLLSARDGDERDYAEIAEMLSEVGARVNADLAELFARVVFNVAVHNTDDHLRNHGLLRVPGGWSLSPVFDVNPEPDLGRRRVTGVLGAVDAEGEIAGLLDLAAECRVRPERARAIITSISRAVARWRSVASSHGIDTDQQGLFAEAFDTQIQALQQLTSG